MAYGIPTVVSAREDSEVARIITTSGGGWVTDCSDTAQLAAKLAEALSDPEALRERGTAALAFARQNFSPEQTALRFESVLGDTISRRRDHVAARAGTR